MKLIYAEMVLAMLEAFKDEKYGNPHFMNGIATVRELIEDMPEAVVRCGDCMMFDLDGADEGEGWCWWHDTIIKLNDYCSYGERRSDVRVYLPNR